MSKLPEWEVIIYRDNNEFGNSTHRLKVFGGWMVSHFAWDHGMQSESSIFVPDPNHEWRLK